MKAIQHYFAASDVGERIRRKSGGYDMEVGEGQTTIRLPNYSITEDDFYHIVRVGRKRKCQAIVVWNSKETRVTFRE